MLTYISTLWLKDINFYCCSRQVLTGATLLSPSLINLIFNPSIIILYKSVKKIYVLLVVQVRKLRHRRQTLTKTSLTLRRESGIWRDQWAILIREVKDLLRWKNLHSSKFVTAGPLLKTTTQSQLVVNVKAKDYANCNTEIHHIVITQWPITAFKSLNIFELLRIALICGGPHLIIQHPVVKQQVLQPYSYLPSFHRTVLNCAVTNYQTLISSDLMMTVDFSQW